MATKKAEEKPAPIKIGKPDCRVAGEAPKAKAAKQPTSKAKKK